MPGPDAGTIWLERTDRGYHAQFHKYFWTGNDANRKARVIAIGKRMIQGTWSCRCCGDELSQDKQADTLFCTNRCRKRAARKRRTGRV